MVAQHQNTSSPLHSRLSSLALYLPLHKAFPLKMVYFFFLLCARWSRDCLLLLLLVIISLSLLHFKKEMKGSWMWYFLLLTAFIQPSSGRRSGVPKAPCVHC